MGDLEKIDEQILGLQQKLKKLTDEKTLKSKELAKESAVRVFKELGNFEKILKRATFKQFTKVVDELQLLKSYNEGYQKELGSDCFGIPASGTRSYLISYLLNTNKLGLDAKYSDFWRVLHQIGETIRMADNPFKIEEEG